MQEAGLAQRWPDLQVHLQRSNFWGRQREDPSEAELLDLEVADQGEARGVQLGLVKAEPADL